MKCMVTGYKGFVGTHVLKALKDAGNEVFGFDIPEHNFTNLDDVDSFIKKNDIQIIVHVGAIAGLDHCMKHPEEAIYNNVWGTEVLCKVAKENNCKFIHTSTWAVKGCLKHPYDISKVMSEDIVRMYGNIYDLDITVLRLGTMYGPGMRPNGAIWAFLDRELNNKEIVVQGDGNQYRQFLWVEDAADAYVKAIQNWNSGEIFEIQGKEAVSIRDLIQIIRPSFKNVKYVDARANDEDSFTIDIIRAEMEIDWHPQVNIRQGIKKLKEYIRNEQRK